MSVYLFLYLSVSMMHCAYSLLPFRMFLPPERIVLHAVASLLWPIVLLMWALELIGILWLRRRR